MISLNMSQHPLGVAAVEAAGNIVLYLANVEGHTPERYAKAMYSSTRMLISQ